MGEERWHNFDEKVDRRGSDCKKYNLCGEDVLPMWIADTDFKVPAPVAEAAQQRVNHAVFGYPCELPEFNQVVKRWMKIRHAWEIEPDWVEFVTGVVPAAIFTIQGFTNPGDKILIQTPLYPPLREAIVDNGRQLIASPFVERDGEYEIDFADFEEKLADPRTKLFVLCNPHNPIGKVYTKDELTRVGQLCKKHSVLVFADEIHADIVFSGNKHLPFASLSQEFAHNSITSLNPGKAFNVAGVRTAAVIIPNQLIRERFLVMRKNNKGMGRTVLGQNVFIACYRECEYYLDQLIPYLEGNIDYVANYIAENIPEIKFKKPQGLYLLWLDCRSLGLSQEALMELFLEKGRIALNSGCTFGEEGLGFVRLNIAAPRDTVKEAMKRIERAVKSLG